MHSTSPTPVKKSSSKKTDGVDFPTAIKAVIEGKRIHKLEWEDRGYFGFLNGDILSLHKPDGKNYQWIINDGDLLGTDWIIL